MAGHGNLRRRLATRRIVRRYIDGDPSRYIHRSARLPHMGDDAGRKVVEQMEALRKVKPGKR